MPTPEPKIDAATAEFVECLRAAAAVRRSGEYILKIILRDGVVKGAFIRKDEPVAR